MATPSRPNGTWLVPPAPNASSFPPRRRGRPARRPTMTRMTMTAATAAGTTWSVVTGGSAPPSASPGQPGSTMSVSPSWPTTRTYSPARSRFRRWSSPSSPHRPRTRPRRGDSGLDQAVAPGGHRARAAGPVRAGERRDSAAGPARRSTSTRPMKAAVATAMTITSGAATVTSGAVGVPGAVYSVNAPSTKQTSPPTVNRPWLVTVNSSTNRTTPAR